MRRQLQRVSHWILSWISLSYIMDQCERVVQHKSPVIKTKQFKLLRKIGFLMSRILPRPALNIFLYVFNFLAKATPESQWQPFWGAGRGPDVARHCPLILKDIFFSKEMQNQQMLKEILLSDVYPLLNIASQCLNCLIPWFPKKDMKETLLSQPPLKHCGRLRAIWRNKVSIKGAFREIEYWKLYH